MKKNFLLITLPIAAVMFFGMSNTTRADNITIWDRNGPSSESEVGEVEPGMNTDSKWWLDGFEYDPSNQRLSIKSGGYNFLNPPSAGDYGDIFIKTGSDAPIYGDIDGKRGNNLVPNTFKYDYVLVLDLNSSSKTYSIFDLDASSTLISAYEPANQGSSPWRYSYGGTQIGTAKSGVDFRSLTLSGFDLSFLNGQEFWVHNTMECGNDNLMGHYEPVPEPATMLLFGTGLVGLAGLSRKRKRI